MEALEEQEKPPPSTWGVYEEAAMYIMVLTTSGWITNHGGDCHLTTYRRFQLTSGLRNVNRWGEAWGYFKTHVWCV